MREYATPRAFRAAVEVRLRDRARRLSVLEQPDVIVRGEDGTFDLEAWPRSRTDDTFEVAAVMVAELWHGVERATGLRKARRLCRQRSSAT